MSVHYRMVQQLTQYIDTGYSLTFSFVYIYICDYGSSDTFGKDEVVFYNSNTIIHIIIRTSHIYNLYIQFILYILHTLSVFT